MLGVLAALTWRKWPDLIVDYGRELYVPWRLSEGDVLYRDIAHYYGPLGVTVNSWLFKLFGPGFDRLFLFNLALLTGFTLLLHRFFLGWAGAVAAVAASTVFLCGFAFGNFVLITNYNFLTPYSHDTVYGTYLAFGALVALATHLQTPQRRWLVIAGLCAGGAYLTKPETTIAAAAVVGAGLLATAWQRLPASDRSGRTAARLVVRDGAVVLAAALVPLALFTAWFVLRLGASEGWTAIHNSWTAIFATSSLRTSATNLFFTGWDAPGENAAKVLRAGGITVAAMTFLVLLALAAGRAREHQRGVALGAVVAFGGMVIGLGYFVWAAPLAVGRGLTVTAGLLVVWRAYRFFVSPPEGEARARAGAAWLWSCFAAALLLKMLLNPRLEHYGFFQAMPATLDLVLFLLADAPRLLERAGGRATLALVGHTGLVAAFALTLALSSLRLWDLKTLPIAEGRDRFYTYAAHLAPQGPMVENARRLVLAAQADARTLTVFPEGTMLNYLLRLRSPLATFEFVPPALAFYGQDRLLGELDADPPELVVVLSRNIQEFGSPVFGFDDASGRRIVKWIEQRYAIAGQFGGNPLDVRELGVLVLRRNPRAPTTPSVP